MRKLIVAAIALPFILLPVSAMASGGYSPDPYMEAQAKAAMESEGKMDAATSKHLADMMDKFKSPAFKAQQQQYQAQMKQQLNLDQWEAKAEEGAEGEDMPFSEKPVLFVSSSVPMKTLRAFAHDLEIAGGIMVIRGGVGGLSRIKPTMEFIATVLNVDEDCEGAACEKRNVSFLIDPLLFETYGINQVPALTYQNKTELISYCDGLDMLPKTNAVIYGDATIGFMLKRIRKLTGYENLTPLIKLLGA